MIKVPATLWNLLEKLGVEPSKMKWSCLFGYLAAKDLSEDEEKSMRECAEWMSKVKSPPIQGYIHEIPKKGAYFVPVGDGMIMKIKCKLPKLKGKVDKRFMLSVGYRNKEQVFKKNR